MRAIKKTVAFCLLALAVLGLNAYADNPQSDNPMRLQQVSDNVYALVGPFGNRSPENLGNNSTSGIVITDEGVVLIDSGGTYKGAQAIHELIKSVTDQPVVTVINSGGQDHRWLGNGYFKEQGAHIIASAAAVKDHKARLQDQFFRLGSLVGDEVIKGTDAVYADETFEDELKFTKGGVDFELKMVGMAHTPGDALIWLPQQRIVFTGDVVYIGRMLGVQSHSNAGTWLEAFDTLAALEPEHLIPGHGPATDLATATKDTRDYLAFLRESVAAFMDDGGDITQISTVDQSQFSYLQDYETLKGRNALQVYQELEWE
ncbi:MAG: MBL fold metallo-hydrolase [Gammaproteobacteria bacterium]